MSYLNQITWEITPKNLPTLSKACPKCGKPTEYINTEKFRVNANKKSLDVWLIYQCRACKSTYNLTLFERIHPNKIDRKLHESFLSNDWKMAWDYGFNRNLHIKNRVNLNLESVDYLISGPDVAIEEVSTTEIAIRSKYNLELRLDTVLSKKLECSRGYIKRLFDAGRIQCEGATYNSKISQERLITICEIGE